MLNTSAGVRAALLIAAAFALAGCSRDKTFKGGCLNGAADCKVASPCTALAFPSGAGEQLEVRVLTPPDGGVRGGQQWPGGSNALGVHGDILIGNAHVQAVISGLGTQNYLDPNGGSLIDLVTRGDDNDGLNEILTVTGVLPGDAAHYTQLDLIDERPNRVGVQVKGTLDGHPDVPVYTLYEVRPGDPGVRIRTEIVNGNPDPQLWFLADGFYWSKREPIPFTAEPGAGFSHPSFGLTTLQGALRRFPFIAASMHAPPYSSYAYTGCNVNQLEGFNSEQISGAGWPRTLVKTRDFLVYERFISVANGQGAAPALDQVFEARRQLFNEGFVTLSGTVQRPGALNVAFERENSIVISEGSIVTPDAQRIPWTQVVPDSSGNFHARVPAGKRYVASVLSFGKDEKAAEQELASVTADTSFAAPFVLPSTAAISFTVMDLAGATPVDAEIFVVPADPATASANAGSFHGQFGSCSPWLGPPPGASPACNRILVSATGFTTVEIPVGHYFLYAYKGPFWSIDMQELTLDTSARDLVFAVKKLALQPAASVSADLHVHGSASFDSQIPDIDRVRSFSASDLDVIVATDHDVVYDYRDVLRELNLQNRMTALTGVETTGHIPFMYVPNYSFPLVIGHYNFWPLKYDPSQPRNGGPFDELLEPGQLFDRIDDQQLWASSVGVRELNHPWADPEFGRALGFPRAIFLDATKDLPKTDDGSNNARMIRALGRAHNHDHHAQEVINGTGAEQFLQYRALWFYMLNEGYLRTGTANSDSHSLVDSTVGVPRNIVFTSTRAGPGFDTDAFNTAIRAGQLFGTNGPVIDATIDLASGGTAGYGLTPIAANEAGNLHVTVRSAPWIPVQELRFIVNGQVVKTINGSAITQATDPFDRSNAHLLRYQGDVPLSQLLHGVTGDAWIVVEAGRALPLAADLGGGLNNAKDGIPDTTDNNGDGVVDANDIQPAGAKYGPLNNPPVPTDPSDPQFHFSNVEPLGYPIAFTNPFVLDRNGNGVFDAPGVKGGRP